mmetsp:Transcript_14201/g.10266  ORF Transcript_14201/g.10266 Transcript_14201/m.10266 type:complete len:99 (+) Transcript_14201:174-470(+)
MELLEEAGLTKVFEEFPIDCVIHFAAKKAVGESVAKPLDYYYNNVVGTANLLRVMQKAGCKKIIFSSSACVYGENPDCREDALLCPKNPYGQTKVIVE